MTRASVRMDIDHAAHMARRLRGRTVRALVEGATDVETVTGRLVTSWGTKLVLDDGERGHVVDATCATEVL